MKNAHKNLLVVAMALLAAGTAGAATLDLAYSSTKGVSESTNMTNGYTTGAMQFVDASGLSFEAFCVEISQSRATAANGLQSYTLASLSGNQGTLLQGLFSSSYATVSSALDKAAFQTAIWEITQDASGVTNAGQAANLSGAGVLTVDSSSASRGNFYFATLGSLTKPAAAADNIAFRDQVNQYLAAASSYSGNAQYQLTVLQNANFQDLLTVSAVPEPETYALMLGGLVAIGFMAGRRRKAR